MLVLIMNLLRMLFGRKTRGGIQADFQAAKVADKLKPLGRLLPSGMRPKVSARYKFRLNYLRRYGILPDMRFITGARKLTRKERNADRKARQLCRLRYKSLCQEAGRQAQIRRSEHLKKVLIRRVA